MGVRRGKRRRAAAPKDADPTSHADAPGGPDAATRFPSALTRPRACAAPADGSFCAVYDAAVLDAIGAHCDSSHAGEVGGVLLGRVCRDERGLYLHVDGHVPALAAAVGSTHVTFTADAWALVHATIDRDHPGATIVGWYHSHPGFGVFLSDMDKFIQRHFFDLPWQVALVVDPIGLDTGTFVWRDGEPTRHAHGIEGSPATTGARSRRKDVAGVLICVALAYLLLWLLTG